MLLISSVADHYCIRAARPRFSAKALGAINPGELQVL
jgi:hypothetical protein